MKLKRWFAVTAGVYLLIISIEGCSTSEVAPKLPPDPPTFTEVPHPVGTDLGDIAALFTDPKAPKDKNFVKVCDSDFNKLKNLTRSKDEMSLGTSELVKKDPVRYHWCFYGRVLALDDNLKKEDFLENKQRLVLETFHFLTLVGKAFAGEFHDSRYLRWAVMRYQKISETVFFRKLDLTPEGTSLLVQPTNPFGLWRKTDGFASVLEKYRLNPEGPARFNLEPQPTATAAVDPAPLSPVAVAPQDDSPMMALPPPPPPDLPPPARTARAPASLKAPAPPTRPAPPPEEMPPDLPPPPPPSN